MRVLVAGSFNADSIFANAINTIKIADGFAKLGHLVTVVCREPKSGTVSDQQLREYFHLSHRVSFVQTPSHWFGIPLSKHNAFAKQVIEVRRELCPDFAYCRSFAAPIALAKSGVPTVAESHAHVGNTQKNLLRMVAALRHIQEFRSLITIAPILKENFVALGVPAEKVHVLPDAVDIELFTRPSDFIKTPRSRPRIVYAGHLYDYKGVPTILDAASKRRDWEFKLIGGHDPDIARVKSEIIYRNLMNVKVVGRIPHSQVNAHLWDADALLLAPSANHPSANWTSPVKLGEYLASGTPIVATRIPALEHWLKDGEVRFVEPDNAFALVDGIEKVLQSPTGAKEMVESGLRLASTISYCNRCSTILSKAGLD